MPPTRTLSLALGILALIAPGCVDPEPTAGPQAGRLPSPASEGRVTARPGRPKSERVARGVTSILGRRGRKVLLFVPHDYTEERPAPLVVALHGAGGTAETALSRVRKTARDRGVIVIAPKSREATWDVIRGGYGPDVSMIGDALARVFEAYRIDEARVAIEGFSDGASYALSLGLTNGDLFTHVMAFSPGFMAPSRREGRPAVFISHGTKDPVLPIGRTSRRIVPQLRDLGYDVRYEEFSGGHAPPAAITAQALRWFLTD